MQYLYTNAAGTTYIGVLASEPEPDDIFATFHVQSSTIAGPPRKIYPRVSKLVKLHARS